LDLKGADLQNVDLTGANLSHAALHDANCRGTNLCEASLLHIDAPGIRFTGANLTGTEIGGSNLERAEFDSSDARGAMLNHTNLSRATFRYSDFSGATFEDSDMSLPVMKSSQFVRSTLTGVSFRETIISDCDMSQCIGLTSVIHAGLSTIGTDTLVNTVRGAGGALTFQQEAFFISAGVSAALLEDVQIRAESEAMKLYKSLISFGVRDTRFANRLFRDFKKRQIICWKCDDTGPRQSIQPDIKSSSLSYDKLIVICSQDSLNRPSVLNEIGIALQKERQLKSHGALDTDVLFLAQRDNYMQSGWNHILKGAMLSKYSADFTSEANYQLQIGLLINALHYSTR
jgi:uncharacterized protein YjbI with pentapeptide repeats